MPRVLKGHAAASPLLACTLLVMAEINTSNAVFEILMLSALLDKDKVQQSLWLQDPSKFMQYLYGGFCETRSATFPFF